MCVCVEGKTLLTSMVREDPTMWGGPSQLNPTFCLSNQGQRDTHNSHN